MAKNRAGKSKAWSRVAASARRPASSKSRAPTSSKVGRVARAGVSFAETIGAAGLTGAAHGAAGDTVGPVRTTTVTRTTAVGLSIVGFIQAWRGKASSAHLLSLAEGVTAAEVAHGTRERAAKWRADRAAAAVPAPAVPAPVPGMRGADGLHGDFQFLISDREGLASPPALAGDSAHAPTPAALHPLLG